MQRASLPSCPIDLPLDLTSLLAEFGPNWAVNPDRPQPDPETTRHWSHLIEEWIADGDLPLFVRKSGNIRGALTKHVAGRDIIYTDNSPAHWAFVMATRGDRPTMEAVRSWMQNDEIPVVYIRKPAEKSQTTFQRMLKKEFNVNTYGWKLAHIDGVGLRSREPVGQLPIERIVEHFRRLMSPDNMFVVPLVWAGIAELEIVIDAIRWRY